MWIWATFVAFSDLSHFCGFCGFCGFLDLSHFCDFCGFCGFLDSSHFLSFGHSSHFSHFCHFSHFSHFCGFFHCWWVLSRFVVSSIYVDIYIINYILLYPLFCSDSRSMLTILSRQLVSATDLRTKLDKHLTQSVSFTIDFNITAVTF